MPSLSEVCMVMCMFLVPTAVIAYEVFGIIYLVETYKDISDPCIGRIWPYVLVSLLTCCSNINATKNGQSVADNCSALICLLFLNAGLSIWGGIELAHPLCQVMMDNHLWKFGFATFILQACSAVLILVVVCCEIIGTSIINSDRSIYNEV
jgi:hypothetical protein